MAHRTKSRSSAVAPEKVTYQLNSNTFPASPSAGDHMIVTSTGTSAGDMKEEWLFDGATWYLVAGAVPVSAAVLVNTIADSALATDIGRYIVPAAGLAGAFVGHANEYADWDGVTWVFTPAVATDKVTVVSGPNAGTNFGFNGTVWTPIVTPLNDFWRSGVGGVTLPNGALDLTENIRRNGFVGLNVDPASTMDVNGSLATAFFSINAAAYTATQQHSTLDLTNTLSTQAITLPGASTATRRIYTLRNATNVAKTVTSYTSLAGIASTTIAPNTSLVLQSNGSTWVSIGESFTGTMSVGQVVAKASVNIGDAVPTGARPISNGFNVTSATGVDGSTTVARMNVVFSSALQSNDYVISGHVTGQTPASYPNESQLIWMIVNKTTTGFTVVFRELAGAVQVANWDFQVIQQNLIGAYAPPLASKYVGPNTGTLAQVQLGNFIVRYNAGNTNLEIATVAGTESILSYDETIWGAAGSLLNVVDSPKAVTTAFSTWGDPGVTINGEHRTYLFTPAATGDARAYVLELAWFTNKVMMSLRAW